MRRLVSMSILILTVCACTALPATERLLEAGLHHLRSGEEREWSSFPAQAEGKEFSLKFVAKKNETEQILLLRQRDVRLPWQVTLNDQKLGVLVGDERDLVSVFRIPPAQLHEGENQLRITAPAGKSDDVFVGEARLADRPFDQHWAEAAVEIEVFDKDTKAHVPCKLTIVDARGSLMPLAVKSDQRLAVRTGAIYTADGQARFGLPAGDYTVYASRGFEYGADSVEFTLAADETVKKSLTIRRQVATPGYVSCDTHIHSREFSGHGDATAVERAITIAGEGLELAIATDHNVCADYGPAARETVLTKYFTTVVGCEVTTKVGHFNVFPLTAGAKPPDHTPLEWSKIFAGIYQAPNVQVAVLNHPRDVHSGFRPFGPEHFLAATGENLDGWKLAANSMELVNSSATQSDPWQVYRDWFALLNHGVPLTPIGASDSHEVDWKTVAQARTYVSCAERDPGKIDVAAACRSFREGRVMVSYGLLAEIQVDGKHGPGDVVPVKDDVQVRARILGPDWARADQVALYANGMKIHEATITAEDAPTSGDDSGKRRGVQWTGTWTLPKPDHDVHLAIIASGPDPAKPFWQVREPYQPTSPDWTPRIIGSTGVVWLDADGDGKPTSALDYATRLVTESGDDLPKLLESLQRYDEAVVMQTAGVLASSGVTPLDAKLRTALEKSGTPAIRKVFAEFSESWKASQAARAGNGK
jgi:hypothetical protein